MSDSLWPPWTAASQASLSFTISWSVLKCLSPELMMRTNHLILCHLLLLPPSIFPSYPSMQNKKLKKNSPSLLDTWGHIWSGLCNFSNLRFPNSPSLLPFNPVLPSFPGMSYSSCPYTFTLVELSAWKIPQLEWCISPFFLNPRFFSACLWCRNHLL